MSSSMTPFHFDVDEDYARQHNEFFRDAKRLQISAAILAALMILAVVLLAEQLSSTVRRRMLGADQLTRAV